MEAQGGSELSALPKVPGLFGGRWDLVPRFPDSSPGSDHHLTWPLIYPSKLEMVAVDIRLSGSLRQISEGVLHRPRLVLGSVMEATEKV